VNNDTIAQAIVISAEWQHFARGHWQKECPDLEGRYPTSDRCGYPAVDQYVHTDTAIAADWDGWWWSEPYPTLPNPPEWGIEIGTND